MVVIYLLARPNVIHKQTYKWNLKIESSVSLHVVSLGTCTFLWIHAAMYLEMLCQAVAKPCVKSLVGTT